MANFCMKTIAHSTPKQARLTTVLYTLSVGDVGSFYIALLNKAPVLHHQDFVRQISDDVHVMGNKNIRQPMRLL